MGAACPSDFCNNSYKISTSVLDRAQKQGGTMLNEFVLITAVCLAIVGALTLFFKEVQLLQK